MERLHHPTIQSKTIWLNNSDANKDFYQLTHAYIRFLQYSLNFTHNKWQITTFLPNEQLYILANAALPDVQIQVPATAITAFPLKSLNSPEQEAELHHHINSLKLKVMEVVQFAKTKSSIIQQKQLIPSYSLYCMLL